MLQWFLLCLKCFVFFISWNDLYHRHLLVVKCLAKVCMMTPICSNLISAPIILPFLHFLLLFFVGVYLNRNGFCCSVVTRGVKHLSHIWLHRDTLNIFIMCSDPCIWHCNIHWLLLITHASLSLEVSSSLNELPYLWCYIVSWFCLGSPLNVIPHSERVVVTSDYYNVYLKHVLF